MKKKVFLGVLLIILMFTVSACNSPSLKEQELVEGLTNEEVVEMWGEPNKELEKEVEGKIRTLYYYENDSEAKYEGLILYFEKNTLIKWESYKLD